MTKSFLPQTQPCVIGEVKVRAQGSGGASEVGVRASGVGVIDRGSEVGWSEDRVRGRGSRGQRSEPEVGNYRPDV